ncbi:MAG: ParA family protein [Actinomycetes bacterium]
MKVLATWSIKGGVGKTSAAANLAYLAAREGRRTLLWDLDPQGAATYLFSVKDKVKGGSAGLVRARGALPERIRASAVPRLDVLPANLRLRDLDLALDAVKRPTERVLQLLDSVADDYDVAVLDCPPSVSLVSENVVWAADVILVPVVPAALSVRTFDQVVQFVGSIAADRLPTVLGFLSLVDGRRRLHRELIEQLTVRHDMIAMTPIPDSAVIESMGERRAPVVQFAPRSTGAKAYEELWIEVARRLWPTLSVHPLHWSSDTSDG